MINLPRHLVNDIAEFDSEDSIDEYDSISWLEIDEVEENIFVFKNRINE
jgi:hypothetical protein